MSNETATTVTTVLAAIRFDEAGLVPAIAQQFDSGEVLMMAWMDREAVAATLSTGRVHYWSRSRRKLWRKGEISGQEQILKDFRWDCDNDTVLVRVDQTGVACHTGRRSCFFNGLQEGVPAIISEVEVDPGSLYR